MESVGKFTIEVTRYSTGTKVTKKSENIDFQTAETMAVICELIAHSSDDRATFIGLVNKFDIKTAIKHFVQSGKSINKTHGFSIAFRRDEVILTVRYPKGKVITHEDNMEIQQGLKEFFKKLNSGLGEA